MDLIWIYLIYTKNLTQIINFYNINNVLFLLFLFFYFCPANRTLFFS